MGSEDRYLGPGHVGIFSTENCGGEISYHFYDKVDQSISKLAVRASSWEKDGWPILEKNLLVH